MENEKSRAELGGLLEILPPVEFCCVYGSTLHPNNASKTSMIDYILGVSDPVQWHSKNLMMNQKHYASLMVHLGGAKLITEISDCIGVGVHFNPFVSLNDKMFKYGVVGMLDLITDILDWESFYLSGRLQKPVNILVDNVGVIANLNYFNLRAATSAALLLLPPKFTEVELYAKICSLSYMGDLRMLFAEDKDKIKKIVQGQFALFQTMYRPFLEEYATQDLLKLSFEETQANISQDCGLSAASSLISHLPLPIISQMGMKLGEYKVLDEFGRINKEVVIGSKEVAAECIRKLLRRQVLVSSARQAVAGLLTVGAFRGARYLGNKMQKAWNSWR